MAVSDALVIGGGPAGASAAILLAQAGWRVTLVEQHAYPRQKVCGECFAAGSVTLLDELGVGEAFRRLAGPPLEQVGWMRGGVTVIAAMPPCPWDAAGYGRALGRDVFDALLLERARMVGVRIVQPARLRSASGLPGSFRCHIEHLGTPQEARPSPRDEVLGASIIIDAHGSWESGPDLRALGETSPGPARRPSDLLAFKATFHDSALAPGLLPVLAVDGGWRHGRRQRRSNDRGAVPAP